MKVTVTHHSNYVGIAGEPYYEEVPDNASLQEIWDICVNGGQKTSELENQHDFETIKEGTIEYNDDCESLAGSMISIVWAARDV